MKYVILTEDDFKRVSLRMVYDDPKKARDYCRKLARLGQKSHIIGCLTYDGAISQRISIKKIYISCYACHYTFWKKSEYGWHATAEACHYVPLACLQVLRECEKLAHTVISNDELIFNA